MESLQFKPINPHLRPNHTNSHKLIVSSPILTRIDFSPSNLIRYQKQLLYPLSKPLSTVLTTETQSCQTSFTCKLDSNPLESLQILILPDLCENEGIKRVDA